MTVFYDKSRDRWRYDFRMHGQRHHGYCLDATTGEQARTKTDAKRIEAELKVAALKEAPTLRRPSDYTFAEMMADYSTRKQANKDWPNKLVYLADLLEWFGAETSVTDITDQMVWDYIAWARKQPVMVYRGGPRATTPEERAKHYAPAKDGRTRADSTINRYLVTLREAIGIAHTAKKLPEPPKVPKLAEPQRLPRPVSEENLNAIIARAPQHLADGVLLARQMGFRKGEVFSLTREQVDFENRGVWLEAEATKANRAEFVPANADAMALLTRLVEQAKERKVPYLFAYQRGKPKEPGKAPWLPVKNPKRAWTTACKALGIKHRFHDTKASYVTAIGHVASGPVTQQLARHKSFETTRRYLLVSDVAARRAVEDATMRVRPVENPPSSTQEFHTDDGKAAPEVPEGGNEKAPDPL